MSKKPTSERLQLRQIKETNPQGELIVRDYYVGRACFILQILYQTFECFTFLNSLKFQVDSSNLSEAFQQLSAVH